MTIIKLALVILTVCLAIMSETPTVSFYWAVVCAYWGFNLLDSVFECDDYVDDDDYDLDPYERGEDE